MTYLEFINTYNGTGNQKHHVEPQSIQRKKTGTVVDERIVYLSPAAHLYAHILYDIENGTYTSKYMRNVSGLNKKALDEITYEDCLIYDDIKKQTDQNAFDSRKGYDGYWKGKERSEETKQKMSEAHKGKKRSEEFCQKMSEVHKGKKQSKEFRQKMSETQKGSTWINNGVVSRRVKKSELIPEGWKLGRIGWKDK